MSQPFKTKGQRFPTLDSWATQGGYKYTWFHLPLACTISKTCCYIPIPQMTLPLHCHLASMFLLLLFLSMVFVDANFTVSETAYYPNSDTKRIESKYCIWDMLLKLWRSHVVKKENTTCFWQILSDGACEYGTFQATLNNFDVSASASLYRNGVGCNVPTHAIGPICGSAPGCENHNTIFLLRVRMPIANRWGAQILTTAVQMVWQS